MVEFVCSWCTLSFCLCALCLFFYHCRVVVVVLCPPPSRPAILFPHYLWPSKPGLLGGYGDGVALPFLLCLPPYPLCILSHPCPSPLCLSILWCDLRRHGLTKLDELRCVPSSFPSSCFLTAFHLLLLLTLFAYLACSPLPTSPHLVALSVAASLSSIL